MKQIILSAIRLYQRYLSARRDVCRFSPTCSEYAYQAIDTYGIILGLWLGFKRVLRCHPFSKGGLDPVPKIT